MIKKKVARKKTTTKPATKPRRAKSPVTRKPSPKIDGLNGRTSLATRQASLVKAAKKEGEKKMLKTLKSKVEKVLRSSKEKINSLLKKSGAQILKAGTKRKTATPKTSQRKRTESPFDMRRFRGVRKKKETTKQKLNRLSNETHTIRDQILLGIANGSFKFKWKSVASETGYGEKERKAMLSILNNNGYTVKGLAHKIWEDNNGNYGNNVPDDEIRDEIIDVLSVVSSAGDALKQLDRGQGQGSKAPF